MKLREMLELAALAVGGFEYVDGMGWIAVDKAGNRGAWWNPSGDDGDSRRLEVALNLQVTRSTGACDVYSVEHNIETSGHGEPLEATRLAVLRCAAEVGKSIRAEGGAA